MSVGCRRLARYDNIIRHLKNVEAMLPDNLPAGLEFKRPRTRQKFIPAVECKGTEMYPSDRTINRCPCALARTARDARDHFNLNCCSCWFANDAVFDPIADAWPPWNNISYLH